MNRMPRPATISTAASIGLMVLGFAMAVCYAIDVSNRCCPCGADCECREKTTEIAELPIARVHYGWFFDFGGLRCLLVGARKYDGYIRALVVAGDPKQPCHPIGQILTIATEDQIVHRVSRAY